jgi:hypothetical protein
VILVLLVFGWTNGQALVKTSYAEAKKRPEERRQKGAEQRTASAEAQPG